MVEPDGHIIQLSGAVAVLGDFPALAGVDLAVKRGEIVCVEGPNGAGKSTLLKLCAGLLPLYEGSGRILGKDLANRKDRRDVRRQTGLLAHQTFLYDELTVIENIEFWAKANRSDLSNVDAVLDRLGLNGRLRTVKVQDLSAGQRRRTSLALMISRRPHIWLLDEPHAALDAAGKDSVDLLISQAVGFGATVLLASHDQQRARTVATRVLTLVGGRIEQSVKSETTTAAATQSRSAQKPNSAVSQDPPISVVARTTGRVVAGRHAKKQKATDPTPSVVNSEPPPASLAQSSALERAAAEANGAVDPTEPSETQK